MKFWGLTDICHTFFQYIKKYFYAQNNPKDKKNQKVETKKKIIKSKPRRGLYKFDPNEISDSDEQSKVIKIVKTKKVFKKQKFLPKVSSRENFKTELQTSSTKQTFVNKSGDEISSISDNEESDSILTVKHFLINLQPSIQRTVTFVSKMKNRKQYKQQEVSNRSMLRIPRKINKSILRRQVSNMIKTKRIPIYQAQKQQMRQNQQESKPLHRPLQRHPFPPKYFKKKFN